MTDILLTISGITILMPLFYVLTNMHPNIYSTTALILLLIPTLRALINGAPFVPTPIHAVKKMLKIGKIKKGDKVYDIGCGDGRFVHLASKKYGAKAVGFELSPIVYMIARIRKLLWRSKAKIKFADFKRQNLSDADIIFCYLLPDTLKRLGPKLLKELKPGAKIISYAFPVIALERIKKYPKEAEKNIAPIWEYIKR